MLSNYRPLHKTHDSGQRRCRIHDHGASAPGMLKYYLILAVPSTETCHVSPPSLCCVVLCCVVCVQVAAFLLIASLSQSRSQEISSISCPRHRRLQGGTVFLREEKKNKAKPVDAWPWLANNHLQGSLGGQPPLGAISPPRGVSCYALLFRVSYACHVPKAVRRFRVPT